METVPRVVTVVRATDLEELIARHGTRGQAKFYLQQRAQSIDEVEARHARIKSALEVVSRAVPTAWRRAVVRRELLSRFVWEKNDIVVPVGQDGLVANVSKYLDEQPVVGVNPEPGRVAGVLVKHEPAALGDMLARVSSRRATIERRTMVSARLDDGQQIRALNEIFVGHRSHQSARYEIATGDERERHSSSGVIVSTGTGASGWAQSIAAERKGEVRLPKPEDKWVAYFVREAWQSRATGATLTSGVVAEGDSLTLTSEMNDGGVVFGDGIEDDRIAFAWGLRARLGVAPASLHLVVA